MLNSDSESKNRAAVKLVAVHYTNMAYNNVV